MSNEREIRSLQLWPRGTTVHYSGDPHGTDLRTHTGHDDKEGTPATDEQRRAVLVEVLAERYVENELLGNDSSLVSDLMKLQFEARGELAEAFSDENVSNLRPDPSDWTLEQCKEWIDDNGHDGPDPNPWAMDRAALIELHQEEIGDEVSENFPEDVGEVREIIIEAMDDEEINGLDDWREVVRDNADSAEIYEWWRVSSWLADKLKSVGECVLDNGYGTWWGRCCTGQNMIMDGTFQKIAEQFAH